MGNDGSSAGRGRRSGWRADVGRTGCAIISNVERKTPNKQWPAEVLIASRDASIRAEGIILLVRSDHPRSVEIIQRFKSDENVNYFMRSNAEVAEQAMSIISLRKSAAKSPSENERIERWLRDGPD